jgi:CheY-like chemotaxis protein/anti-sigma regulatory factor (Ser/Thr protein kinase)
MTTILVVDDSAVDRQLVAGLLKRDGKLEVEFAAHGADALRQMEQRLPDLVLTDLIMPEMDGLDLVAAVRRKYPSVPVILMTSRGSEEIAVQALQRGAASYVPKRALGQRVYDTIQKVLAVAVHQRHLSRLMGCMTRSECDFVLDNDSALIGPLVSYLQECMTRMGLYDDADLTRVGVALEEALVNAIYHGNLEIGSELRENDRAYYALVRRRREERPYCDRRIYVRVSLTREAAEFAVRDEGNGFDPTALPDPTDPANLEKTCGRGVLLMRTFMDDVRYNDCGNMVTLTKRCGPAALVVAKENA